MIKNLTSLLVILMSWLLVKNDIPNEIVIEKVKISVESTIWLTDHKFDNKHIKEEVNKKGIKQKSDPAE